MTKQLLIKEYPLIVLPSLAVKIGLSEAIVLQQLHYWINHRTPDGKAVGTLEDGQRWIRNTVVQWRETNFPFWSEKTIRNLFSKLENAGYIKSRKDLNKLAFDRTKWYSINYDLIHSEEITEWEHHSEEIAESHSAKTTKCHSEEITDTIPETTKEITKETTTATDFEIVVKHYENNIAMITSRMGDVISDALEEYPVDWIIEAINIAVERNHRNWRYVAGILRNWKEKGKDNGKQNSSKSQQVGGQLVE